VKKGLAEKLGYNDSKLKSAIDQLEAIFDKNKCL